MSETNPAWGKPNSPVGRVNRKEYFISSVCLLTYFACALFCAMFLGAIGSFWFGRPISTLISLFFLVAAGYIYWQYLMLCIKRWHDLNLSGWMCLITFACSCLPLFCFFLISFTHQFRLYISLVRVDYWLRWGLLILSTIQLFLKGTKGKNKYGDDPLGYQKQSRSFWKMFFCILLLVAYLGYGYLSRVGRQTPVNTMANAVILDITLFKLKEMSKSHDMKLPDELQKSDENKHPCDVIITGNPDKSISITFPDKCVDKDQQIPADDVIQMVQKLMKKHATFECQNHKCIMRDK